MVFLPGVLPSPSRYCKISRPLSYLLQRVSNFPLQPTREQRVSVEAQHKIRAIGQQLLEERKTAIMREKSGAKGSHDLLTLLLKANMNPNISDKQRLSDEDVIARKCLPAFIVVNV